MRPIRCGIAAVCLALSVGLPPAYATSFSTDQSDLWYIPSESGWGIQLVERGSLIFITMFVYDPSGKPIWYVGTLNATETPFVWTGDIYVTNGPWFGAQPYNPALFGGRVVGSMTWNAPFVTSGTLTYTVDGISVTKNIIRQTLVNDDFNGTFVGAAHETVSCAGVADVTTENFAGLGVVQNGTQVSLASVALDGNTCTYSGQLGQDGQFGSMNGTYSCVPSGQVGNFHMFEMNVGVNSLTARYTANSSFGCQITGYLGGMRHR